MLLPYQPGGLWGGNGGLEVAGQWEYGGPGYMGENRMDVCVMGARKFFAELAAGE